MDQEPTPYAPPQSQVATPAEEALDVIPAGKWLRVANLLIDYFAYTVLSMLIGMLVALVFGDAGIQYLRSVPRLLIGTPIVVGYYLVFEATLGRTLGKFVTGTRVVNAQGRKPAFKQIVGRTLARLIPFEALTFLSSTRRGWHDRLPDTYVVRCR